MLGSLLLVLRSAAAEPANDAAPNLPELQPRLGSGCSRVWALVFSFKFVGSGAFYVYIYGGFRN